eukprot:TRINITY_DN1382_c3_g1_i1.p1 TRINITY_DN1382_c3_g1~~TRINITY_DN1382_c3_g1_i1.p1  ORF type:complete len:319 (-),score=136.07 TRINITY_DN1382_c3_g1_i1:112-1068(-)
MTGFFFGGGDQSLLRYCLFDDSKSETNPTPVLATILEQYNEFGAVIAGTSAGTMIQVGSDNNGPIPLITSGESHNCFVYSVSNYAKYDYNDHNPHKTTVNPYGGFGNFDYGLLDTHFSQRGRQGRLVCLAYNLNVRYGFGIDENTALVVDAYGNMEVVGPAGVTIVDVANAYQVSTVYDQNNNALFTLTNWNLFNITYNYLTDGDRFEPNTGRITISNDKSSILGKESRAQSIMNVGNIFAANIFTSVAIDLFDSQSLQTIAKTHLVTPQYATRMTKVTGQSNAYKNPTQNSNNVLTIVNMKLDFYSIVPFDDTLGDS